PPSGPPCVAFRIDGDTAEADPDEVFPALDFELRWFDRYEVHRKPGFHPAAGEGPDFDAAVERISARDRWTGEAVGPTVERTVPKPTHSDGPGGRESTIAFSDLVDATFPLDPADVEVEIRLDQELGAGVRCFAGGVGFGSADLRLPCTCGGH